MKSSELPARFSREKRRAEAIAKGFNGIDFVDVAPDRQTLIVGFFLEAPKETRHRFYRIVSEADERDVRILEVRHDGGDDPIGKNHLKVRIDHRAGHATYRFEVVDLHGFDPLFRSVSFRFDATMDLATDCALPRSSSLSPGFEPELDYTAKDFDSLRTLIVNRFSLNVPDWTETHLPDLGVTLVDLLAYVGDQLSYFQDSVATEAYLDTCRFRISARRHARLVDYKIREGCNARTWISIETDTDIGPFDASNVSFSTTDGTKIFEPVDTGPIEAKAALTSIALYTWGGTVASLPVGTTRATLLDGDLAPATEGAEAKKKLAALRHGDVVIFEEVLGAATGSPYDADPNHRHAVRITSVRHDTDPVYDMPIVEVFWSIEDRLPFAVTLIARTDDGSVVEGVSVVRANVLLADHGSTVQADEDLGVVPNSGRFTPRFAQPDLTFREPPNPDGPAAPALAQNPREATPQIAKLVSSGGDAPNAWWHVRYDLLESGASDDAVVVEMDDRRIANLRFGDGVQGRRPDPGSRFSARYRVGNGSAGNVGPDTVVALHLRNESIAGAQIVVRNPLPASGGRDFESLAEIKLVAPRAFATVLERAVTADDYATIAQRNPRVFQAAATFVPYGLRKVVRVALDPLGTQTVAPALIADVAESLEHVRSIGHDVDVVSATYVPIDLHLHVSLLPDYVRGHVEAALLDVFGNRVAVDGTVGFFSQERVGFGTNIYESQIIAAAQKVAGVKTLTITRLSRLFEHAESVNGILAIGPLEVAQLRNDPNDPAGGRLRIVLSGGR